MSKLWRAKIDAPNDSSQGIEVLVGDFESTEVIDCTVLYDGITVTIDSDDDVFKSIKCGGCTIDLVMDIDAEAPRAYGAQDVPVKILRDGGVKFMGYLTPSAYDETWSNGKKHVTLECLDCLAILKYIRFADPMVATQSYQSVVTQAVYKGEGSAFLKQHKCTITEPFTDIAVEDLTIPMAAFVNSKKDKSVMWYDVLEAVLQWAGQQIVQIGDSSYIIIDPSGYSNTCWWNKDGRMIPMPKINLEDKITSSDITFSRSDVVRKVVVKPTREDAGDIVSSVFDGAKRIESSKEAHAHINPKKDEDGQEYGTYFESYLMKSSLVRCNRTVGWTSIHYGMTGYGVMLEQINAKYMTEQNSGKIYVPNDKAKSMLVIPVHKNITHPTTGDGYYYDTTNRDLSDIPQFVIEPKSRYVFCPSDAIVLSARMVISTAPYMEQPVYEDKEQSLFTPVGMPSVLLYLPMELSVGSYKRAVNMYDDSNQDKSLTSRWVNTTDTVQMRLFAHKGDTYIYDDTRTTTDFWNVQYDTRNNVPLSSNCGEQGFMTSFIGRDGITEGKIRLAIYGPLPLDIVRYQTQIAVTQGLPAHNLIISDVKITATHEAVDEDTSVNDNGEYVAESATDTVGDDKSVELKLSSEDNKKYISNAIINGTNYLGKVTDRNGITDRPEAILAKKLLKQYGTARDVLSVTVYGNARADAYNPYKWNGKTYAVTSIDYKMISRKSELKLTEIAEQGG